MKIQDLLNHEHWTIIYDHAVNNYCWCL